MDWHEILSTLGTGLALWFFKWLIKKSQEAMKDFIRLETQSINVRITDISVELNILKNELLALKNEVDHALNHAVTTKQSMGELANEIRMKLDANTIAINKAISATGKLSQELGKVTWHK